MFASSFRKAYRVFLAALDARVFPVIVAYATYPLVILATLLLLGVLLLWATNTTLVLVANSYLNVASAAVSSIVLATSLKQHHENQRLHDTHHQDLQALHAKVDALTPASPAPAAPTRDAKGRFVKASRKAEGL